jgi:hypothetical protein
MSVRPLSYHLPLVQHHDPVARLDCPEAVGDENDCPLARESADGFHYLVFRQPIEGVRGFVEYQHIGLMIGDFGKEVSGNRVEQYKRNNLLEIEITSKNVALMVEAMVSPAFRYTTGVQVPLDGGNERVI